MLDSISPAPLVYILSFGRSQTDRQPLRFFEAGQEWPQMIWRQSLKTSLLLTRK